MPDKVHASRKFLFLQGPHGPFFSQLGRMLALSGAQVAKIGFNQGDRFFWRDHKSYQAFDRPAAQWPEFCANALDQGVSDLVLYGEGRPHHKIATALAKERGIRIHFFEEGYLRPYWVTYERGGVNGNSPVMDLDIEDMRTALARLDDELPEAPARWGELRGHVFYGALYHAQVLFRNRAYPHYKPHRDTTLIREFISHLNRFILLPWRAVFRNLKTARLRRSGKVYHLALLQLGHDASVQEHSDFDCNRGFIQEVIAGFAQGAPLHHRLVFKAHPLEDYQINLSKLCHRIASEHGIADRVDFISGGKLAKLLVDAKSVVTINSTAAQQALWRGLPVKALGRSVYARDGLVSAQELPAFFGSPDKPDLTIYRDYRRYLLATSQVSGGFYSRWSRARLLRQVADMVLATTDPYEALGQSDAAPRQQLKLIGNA